VAAGAAHVLPLLAPLMMLLLQQQRERSADCRRVDGWRTGKIVLITLPLALVGTCPLPLLAFQGGLLQECQNQCDNGIGSH